MEEESENDSFIERINIFVRKNPLFVGVIGVGVMLLVVGGFQYLTSKNTKDEAIFIPAGSKGEVSGITTQAKEISVDIEGSVQKPGVYKLKEGARVQDALIASGGMSSAADRDYVSRHFNLAQKLIDGAKLYIPQKGEQNTAIASVEQNFNSNDGANLTVGDNSGLTNINSATVNELDALPKVGPVTAQKIISGRPYNKVEDLVSKKIMTQKTFDGLKDRITVE